MTQKQGAMERFLERHKDVIMGTLSGPDRVLLRGTLRSISPEESQLFRVIMKGEHAVEGFRNEELRQMLEPDSGTDPQQRKQAVARVRRRSRLLRAHGLIYKVKKTNYYRVTDKGQKIMSTAIKFRNSDIALLAA